MKKIIFTLSVISLSLLTLPSFAQNSSSLSRHELRLQLSDGLPFSLTNAFFDAFKYSFEKVNDQVFNYRDYKRKMEGNGSGTPHLGIGYKYHISNRFNIGVDVSFQSSKDHYRFEPKANVEGEAFTGNVKRSMTLIMPTVEYIYMDRPKVKLYGNLKGGIALLHKEENYTNPAAENQDINETVGAIQFNPIAVRYGRQVAGFLELGGGYQGILTLGLSIHL